MWAEFLYPAHLFSSQQNPAPQLFPPSAWSSFRKCTLSEDRRRLGKGREWLPGPTCRLGGRGGEGGGGKRPEINPGRPGWIKACAGSPGPAPNAGAVTWSPGTPAPGDRVRDQGQCLEEGAGSQESVPARWSYSCEPSEAPPASPGLQRGEPAPGGLASERTRVRARARARPATAQGEGKPRQPVRGTGVKPPTNFNCQSDLMGY